MDTQVARWRRRAKKLKVQGKVVFLGVYCCHLQPVASGQVCPAHGRSVASPYEVLDAHGLASEYTPAWGQLDATLAAELRATVQDYA